MKSENTKSESELVAKLKDPDLSVLSFYGEQLPAFFEKWTSFWPLENIE